MGSFTVVNFESVIVFEQHFNLDIKLVCSLKLAGGTTNKLRNKQVVMDENSLCPRTVWAHSSAKTWAATHAKGGGSQSVLSFDMLGLVYSVNHVQLFPASVCS